MKKQNQSPKQKIKNNPNKIVQKKDIVLIIRNKEPIYFGVVK